MNHFVVEGLVALTAVIGFVLIGRDWRRGHARLWLANRQLEVTRDAQPLLFWTAMIGWLSLFSGIAAICIWLLTARP